MEKEGHSIEVIDLRTVRPIDYATIFESVKKTNRCVVVEEAWPLASISGDLTFNIQKTVFDFLDAPILRVNSLDVPVSYAPTLLEAVLPNKERTVKALRSVMYLD
jgi:pyruvate dehydrogenase E1 component beta subunit